MVSDMITHHESGMKDRLSGKPGSVSQTSPHRSLSQFENVPEDPAAERTQNQSQAKHISKEDPMSHRVIEKRRRDRMNNCLADLSRLIPAEYMKKGRGRVEKTEIIEMAIKHMKYLQSNVPSPAGYQPFAAKETKESDTTEKPEQTSKTILIEEQYKLGYYECMTETIQYLVVGHGYPPSHGLCLSLISHLQNHCAQIVKGQQVPHDEVKDEFVMELNRFNTNMLMNLSANCGNGTAVQVESVQQQQNSSSNSRSQSSVGTSNEQGRSLADRSSLSFTSDSYSSANRLSLYKFKTDIKQRFSAESSGADSTDFYAPADKKRRRRETSSPPDCGAEDRQDVPIFALHTNGSYYIPLTVDRDVISPMLDTALQTDDRSSSVSVHPISISVNFQAARHHHHHQQHHHQQHHHRQS